MPPRTGKHRKQRRPALFWLVGKGGVLLISGVLMTLITGLGSVDSVSDFDPPDASLPERMDCILHHISDGDTVVARCDGMQLRIRLFGIDAPEMGQKPWGGQSKAALGQRLPQKFALQSHGYDVYQRVLGTIYSDDRDINLTMLETGDAVVYGSEGTPPAYYEAEQKARAARRGIWSASGDQQNPRRWRRYHL